MKLISKNEAISKTDFHAMLRDWLANTSDPAAVTKHNMIVVHEVE
jgi:hypothetical protein